MIIPKYSADILQMSSHNSLDNIYRTRCESTVIDIEQTGDNEAHSTDILSYNLFDDFFRQREINNTQKSEVTQIQNQLTIHSEINSNQPQSTIYSRSITRLLNTFSFRMSIMSTTWWTVFYYIGHAIALKSTVFTLPALIVAFFSSPIALLSFPLLILGGFIVKEIVNYGFNFLTNAAERYIEEFKSMPTLSKGAALGLFVGSIIGIVSSIFLGPALVLTSTFIGITYGILLSLLWNKNLVCKILCIILLLIITFGFYYLYIKSLFNIIIYVNMQFDMNKSI